MQVTAHDGIPISYRAWGRPAMRPVVLHHEFVADAQINWVVPEVVDALVDAGHQASASTPVAVAGRRNPATRRATARTPWLSTSLRCSM